MCKIFSHPVRLRILGALRDGEECVKEIARKLGVGFGTVSPHLLMMKRRGVLLSRKDANRIYYRLAAPRMLEAFDLIRDILSERIRKQAQIVGGTRS